MDYMIGYMFTVSTNIRVMLVYIQSEFTSSTDILVMLVYIQSKFDFGGVYCGAKATLPFTLSNKVRIIMISLTD